MIKKIWTICLLAVAFGILNMACSKEGHLPGMKEGEGEVVFQFVKNKTFDINKMEDIASIKVTVEKEGVRTVLPSLKISGEADSLYSEPFPLKSGTYKIVSYQVFAANASMLTEMEPEEELLITVEAGKQAVCCFPVKIKVIYINNTIKNVLLGICREIFGDDKTLWPWSEDEADITKWSGLEFELDDNGGVAFLSNITFDERFAPMKKVPDGLSALATVEGLTFENLDLEELPEDLGLTNITSLALINTKLKKFPTNLSRMKLAVIHIDNSELTELPAEIGDLSETMRVLTISGSHLTTLPAEIGKLRKLVNLRVTNSELTSLPDVFESLYHISHMDFSGNPGLSALPASIAKMKELRGIALDGCPFTAVPEVVKQCRLLINIWMQDCKLTTLGADEFAGHTRLDGLYLSGNQFSAFPVLRCSALMSLGLNNCGLSTVPDLSDLPELRALYLEGNHITALPASYFEKNRKLIRFSLADNASLSSFPRELGIALDENGKPANLALVDVSNCPVLHWEVPANWCCMQIQPKEDILIYDPDYTGGDLIIRRVNVKREGSPGVTRKPCTSCGSVE